MNIIRLAIVGSRNFQSLRLFVNFIGSFIDNKLPLREDEEESDISLLEIVSGRGGAVDLRAEAYADLRGIAKLIYPAMWRGPNGEGPYDASAGPKRNRLIVERATHLVAFYDGFSPKKSGTLGSVELAAARGIPFIIITGHEHLFL